MNVRTIKTRTLFCMSIMLVSMTMLVSVNSLQAQPPEQQGPPPAPNQDQIGKMVEDLAKTLSLSDEQEIEVSEKYFEHFTAVEKKMKAARPDRETMEAIKTDFDKEVMMLLTKDQQALYQTYLKEHRQARPKR